MKIIEDIVISDSDIGDYSIGEQNMNFLTLASERTSIRKYENKEIANELIDKILEAGRIAPTSY